MTGVFADTFYWIALVNREDSAHEAARAFDRGRGGRRILTTEEVLDEFLTHFAGRGAFLREKAVLVARWILSDPTVDVQMQSHATFLAGLELYAARPDKGYSLTDCVSMHTMRRHGLVEALTNDRHFEQEGFRALFASGRFA